MIELRSETDEVGTLTALKAHRREVVDPAISEHNGRIVKTTGDGMLVEFASAVDAVTCAVEVREKMAERKVEGTGPRIQFRVGINVGDIIIDGDDIFGEGVNVAACRERVRAGRRQSVSAMPLSRSVQLFDPIQARVASRRNRSRADDKLLNIAMPMEFRSLTSR